MAFSASQTSFSCLSSFPQTSSQIKPLIRFPFIRTTTRAATEPDAAAKSTVQTTTKTKEPAAAGSAQPAASSAPPKTSSTKPVFSMKKGQIVRVDKQKYLESVNYLSVGHPTYYKGLDYIYEDRGEVLDLRMFETGEHALVAWVGVPTAPAWLPTNMLIKSEKLNYERL